MTHDTTEAKLRWLEELSAEAMLPMGEEAAERQHARGKLLARERVERLLDPGSFRRARPVRAAPRGGVRDA